MLKRIIDIMMTIALMCLMAFQVTGEKVHEWIGIVMVMLVIVHQVLNKKWYSALFKGKYNLYRVFSSIINILLIISFALTAISGMSMSNHAVPFLHGLINVNNARVMHLAFSYWSFILMGLHLGMHILIMTNKMPKTIKLISSILMTLVAGYGLYLFINSGISNYILFKSHFAFLDYEKSAVVVFLENLSMLSIFAFLAHNIVKLIQNINRKEVVQERIIYILVSFIIAFLLNQFISVNNVNTFSNWNNDTLYTTNQNEIKNETTIDIVEITDKSEIETSTNKEDVLDNANIEINDGFIKIEAGNFMMGSPDNENWRIDDEKLHQVDLYSFFIDKYETTQKEYEELMGINPSEFKGVNLPVENVSWYDALNFANAKSLKYGLKPCYNINGYEVQWDLTANGYRLPTEAEWEYACRAGTTTPFNIEKSINADEANFYGHYPYEIEENYFNDSVLEAKPGTYRNKTIEVGSFLPNKYGLYDMHGNVNEWCFDYYAEYDLNNITNPTGGNVGTRHIYRGGGWNDFAKNMRSAYRAAVESTYKSYNLGVRLVRSATVENTGTIVLNDTQQKSESKNILIAYFSWSGNTRGIANQISMKTGARVFEISPSKAYSENYNTVLMQAQDDQHHQRRPQLKNHVENMDEYDTILLGYPNWWASIPMPIATFLEEYDFTNKTIIPFCSHGGGRFGQSITAISKLAPSSNIAEGLSVHYSGGSSLSEDIDNWLIKNNINISNR